MTSISTGANGIAGREDLRRTRRSGQGAIAPEGRLKVQPTQETIVSDARIDALTKHSDEVFPRAAQLQRRRDEREH